MDLNLHSDFLCGCDCTDNCSDKSRCQCFQMTIAGAKYKNNMPDDPESISYVNKRLYEVVQTGIFECNSRCKCNSRCLNRVVQHPIEEKLQVFLTKNKGWGIRTSNFIPKGAFICNYVGHLYPEDYTGELAAKHGDKFFAALDFLEKAQAYKEGYENDVVMPRISRANSQDSSSSSTISLCSDTSGSKTTGNVIDLSEDDDSEEKGDFFVLLLG